MEFNLNSEERRAATAELAELDRSNIEKAYQIDVYTLREKSKDCTNGGETASIDRFILYTWRMSRAAVLLDVERRELPLAKCLHACRRVIYGRSTFTRMYSPGRVSGTWQAEISCFPATPVIVR